MSGAMRATLKAWPKVKICCPIQASIDYARGCGRAGAVANVAVDAVIFDEISGSQRVSVVCKGPVLDAFVGADAITAKAEDGVQDDGLGEGPGVTTFLPVSGRC